MHELPLVFFTVFGQLAAGMVLVSSLYYLSNRQKNNELAIEKVNIIALIVMGLGMLIASFHLGHPFRALNVIFGIGRSPMSNEIFTFGLLFGVTFVGVVLAYFNQSTKGNKLPFIKNLCLKINTIPQLPKILSILLSLLSLVFIWTIVLTYMLPTVKTWDTYYTAIQMYTTMLALGGIATAMLGLPRLGIILFFIGSVCILVLKIPYLNLMTSLAPELTSDQHMWMIAQCALLVLAMMLAIPNTCRVNKSTAIYVMAFILVLLGELCGRIVFYNLWTVPM